MSCSDADMAAALAVLATESNDAAARMEAAKAAPLTKHEAARYLFGVGRGPPLNRQNSAGTTHHRLCRNVRLCRPVCEMPAHRCGIRW
jgi:hypothetical protein